MQDFFADDSDMEFILIDSAIARARHSAAGAPRKGAVVPSPRKKQRRVQNIHMAFDKRGRPLRITVSGGERRDITQADAPIDGFDGEYAIANRGYDSNKFAALIADMGMAAAIPPRSNRNEPRPYDKEQYKVRNAAERFIGRVKHRRVATRYDKLSRVYLWFLQFASVFMWMQIMSTLPRQC